MRKCVESVVLYGRLFGGVSVLVNRKLEYCTEIVSSADRYVIVNVGNSLVVNLYLPSVGTEDRMYIIDEILSDISNWIHRYRITYLYGLSVQLLRQCARVLYPLLLHLQRVA